MAKKTTKKRNQSELRKKKYTDTEVKRIEEMAFNRNNIGTIASVLGLDYKTLQKYHGEMIIRKHAEGRAALKKAQMDKAIKDRDSTMLIWLGKNELEQTDKQQVEHDGGITVEIVNYAGKANNPV